MKQIFTILTFFVFLLLINTPAWSQIVSKQDGVWNSTSTWNGGVVPTSSDNVVINHAVTTNSAITRGGGTTTTINAGHSLAVGAAYTNNGTTNVYGTFQLNSGGWAEGSNDLSYYSGSYLVFNNGGNYDINSGQRFWPSSSNTPDNVEVNTGSSATLNDTSKTINNLILYGGFSNNKTLTVNGNLTINAGGYVANTPPTYGTSSTLIYSSGGPYYNLGQEWRASSPPKNVQITNNTTLNYPTFLESKTIHGTLTIDAGSSLYMDYGSPSSAVGPLTVEGDINVTGNLSLGKYGGDDIKTLGDLNFYSGYNFYPNNRAVWFIKPSGTQKITTPSNGAISIPYLVIGTSSGSGTTVQLGQNLTVEAALTGNAIAFTNSGDIIDLNGHNLSIGTSGISNQISGPGSFKGNTTSDLTLLGTGSAGSLSFTAGYQQLRNLIVSRTSGQEAATLATPLTLNGTGTTFTNGLLEISNNNLTFNAAADYTSAGSGSFIATDGTGKVIKNFSAAGSFVYPIGDNNTSAHYSPATINLTSITGTPAISMNVVNAKHPQNTSATSYLNRYWSVTSTGTYSANATFNYITGDVTGTEANLITAGWNGTNWNLYGNVNTGTHSLEISGQSNLNKDFTAGDQFSPVATLADNYFRSRQTGNWHDASNWESSPNGTDHWSTATLAPTSSAKQIDILSTHTISVVNTISLNNSRVYGKLSLLTGGKINIPNSDPDGIDVKAGGIFEVATTGTYATSITLPVGASFTSSPLHVETDGIVMVNKPSSGTAGSGYDSLAINSNNKWENKSKFIWNNGLNFALGTSTNPVSYFPKADASTIPRFIINTVVSNGSGGATTINGLTIVNANTTFSGGGDKIFRNGIAGNATLTQDGSIANPGNFQITGSSAILGGSGLTLNLTKILNLNSNTEVPVDSVVIINKNTGTSTSGSISKASNVVFTVNGTADMTTINMDNTTGSVVVNGYLKTAAANGLKGSSNSTITSGTVNVNSGSTIEYNATGDQAITSSGTLSGTAPYYNLILSGGGTKTPSNAIYLDIAGSLKITGATTIVDATSNNIGPNNTSNSTSFTMDGGRLKLGKLGFTGSGTLPSMKGTYNLTGGVVEFAGGTSSTSQSIRSGESYSYYNIEVSGPYVSTSGGNVNLKDGGSFKINSGGSFTINANSINGVTSPSTASVEVKSGGTFNVGNTGGFNGRAPAGMGDTTSAIHANISAITLDPGSTVAYTRSNPPLAGDGSQPITTGSFTYQNLKLSGTGNKIAPFKSNLPINGDFTVSGAAQFAHDSGTVTFINTTATQNINAAGVTYPPVFYNLTNLNTQNLSVNNMIAVKSKLTLGNSSKLNLTDSIRLISDNAETASVPPIPDGANAATINYNVKGAFIVERYIPNHSKAWQLLSVPTKGSTIKQAWQNNQVNVPNRGVNITAPYGDWATRGFDQQSPNPSMKVFNPATNSYDGVTNTANPIANPNGYFLFVRGDRSVNDPWAPATEVTLQTAGRLYAPTPAGEAPSTITVPANSFVMIGNPYASAIKYNQITLSSNLQDYYYIWDPQLTSKPSSNFGLGGFRSIAKNDANATPQSGNYLDGSIPPIQSGQAFFVFNPSATDGSVSFSENAKISGSNSIFRPGKVDGADEIALIVNLLTPENGSDLLLDGVRFVFDSRYSPLVDQQDAKKLLGTSEGISILAEPYPLAVDRRPMPAESDTVFFGLNGMRYQPYTIIINPDMVNKAGYDIYLHDAFANKIIQIKGSDTRYNFSVSSNSASSAPKRIYLTFKPTIPPFAFANEKAIVQGDNASISWSGISQSTVAGFTVEQSQDGINFIPVGKPNVKGSTNNDYDYTVANAPDGLTYYRIKASLKDGSVLYSKTVEATIHYGAPSIRITPNPVKDVIRLQFYRMPQGKYQVNVFTIDGRKVIAKDIYHDGGSADYSLAPPSMAKGIYHLEIRKPDGNKINDQLMLDK